MVSFLNLRHLNLEDNTGYIVNTIDVDSSVGLPQCAPTPGLKDYTSYWTCRFQKHASHVTWRYFTLVCLDPLWRSLHVTRVIRLSIRNSLVVCILSPQSARLRLPLHRSVETSTLCTGSLSAHVQCSHRQERCKDAFR